MPRYPNRTPFERAVDGVITPEVAGDSLYIPVGRCATLIVAANSSSTLSKQQADYVCDGTADQVQIQAAIDALPVVGGKVLLLEGTYYTSTSITITSNYIHLEGMGFNSTRVKSAFSGDIISCSGDFATRISSIHFQEIGVYTVTCIKFSNSNLAQVFKCDFDEANIGIHVDSGSGFWFDNLYFEDTDVAIKLDGSSSTVSEVIITNAIGVGNSTGEGSEHGIWCRGTNCKDIYVTNSVFRHYAYAGILLDSSASNIAITNSLIKDNEGYGIYCNNVSNVKISNCNVRNNSQVTANTYRGIDLRDSNRCVIHGNSCCDDQGSKTQKYGIQEIGTSDYNQIIRNDVAGNASTGLPTVGIHTISYEKHTDLLMDVLAVSATHVRSNEDLSVATPITFTLTAQPDTPRTLSWSFDTHAQITEYDMEVIGIDAKGNTVTETWDETAGWSGETNNAFATITSIKMTSRTGTGAGDTMDVGITDVLGLSNIIYETSDVFKIKKNNANATVATVQVNTTYDTYDMSVIGLAGGDDFTIYYKSNLNIIN